MTAAHILGEEALGPWLSELRAVADGPRWELEVGSQRFDLRLPSEQPERFALAILNNALLTLLPAEVAWRVDGDDLAVQRAFEALTAPLAWGRPSVAGMWCARAHGAPLLRREWGSRGSPALSHPAPPPQASRVIGVDVGGTDLKLVAWEHGVERAQRVTVWPRPLGELLADDALLEHLVAECSAIGASLGGPPRAIGLAFPDHVVGGRITGGLTTKTRRLTDTWGDANYWRAFEARVATLPARLAERLGCDVHALSDGAAAAWRVREVVTGPALAISLGTSLTAAFVDAHGHPSELPAYASGLILAPSAPAWSAHPATGLHGVAKALPTQTGLLLAAGRSLTQPERELAQLLASPSTRDEAALARAGVALGELVEELMRWLPQRPTTVLLLGRVIAGGPGSAVLLRAARSRCPVPLQLSAAEDELLLGQARGAARYAGAR